MPSNRKAVGIVQNRTPKVAAGERKCPPANEEGPSHPVRRPLKGHLPSPARAHGRFLSGPVEDEAAALTAQPVRQVRTGFADGEALPVRGFRSALVFGERLQIAFYHFCYLVPVHALEKAATAGNLRCIHNSLKQASGCFHTVAGVRLVPAPSLAPITS